jgi:hypothetical protein
MFASTRIVRALRDAGGIVGIVVITQEARP